MVHLAVHKGVQQFREFLERMFRAGLPDTQRCADCYVQLLLGRALDYTRPATGLLDDIACCHCHS